MQPIEVYHIQKGRLVRVSQPGTFGRGDCYLIDAGSKIYLWIGPKSTPDEKFLTAAEAVLRDTARKGSAQIERIEGEKEPAHFKALFPNFRLTDEDTASMLKKVQLEKKEYKLWRVSHQAGQTFYTEVPLKWDSLRSDDVFILDTWNEIFIWQGKKSLARERFDATVIARSYDAERVGAQKITIIEEGEEPQKFKQVFK